MREQAGESVFISFFREVFHVLAEDVVVTWDLGAGGMAFDGIGRYDELRSSFLLKELGFQ